MSGIKKLVELECDINVQDDFGNTPLLIAAAEPAKYADMIEDVLIECSADVIISNNMGLKS